MARSRTGRVRKLATPEKKKGGLPAAPAKVRSLAKSFFTHNEQKNYYTRESNKVRGSLFKELQSLKDEGEDVHFIAQVKLEDKSVPLDIDLVEGSDSVADMKLLKELVSEEEWWKIVSATKTKVEQVAGKTVADRVFSSEPNGKFNASVKVSK